MGTLFASVEEVPSLKPRLDVLRNIIKGLLARGDNYIKRHSLLMHCYVICVLLT